MKAHAGEEAPERKLQALHEFGLVHSPREAHLRCIDGVGLNGSGGPRRRARLLVARCGLPNLSAVTGAQVVPPTTLQQAPCQSQIRLNRGIGEPCIWTVGPAAERTWRSCEDEMPGPAEFFSQCLGNPVLVSK